MLIHIDMVNTISNIDDIKSLNTNCRLASFLWDMSTNTRVIIMDLYDLCFSIAGPVCGESTAHWRIPVRTINSVELCCLINAFRIAGWTLMFDKTFPLCWPSVWCLLFFHSSWQKSRSFDDLFHVCPNELLNKQWRRKWVENSWNSDYVTVM